MPFFARYRITPSDIVYNDCANVYLSAYILRYNYVKKGGSWFDAIVSYNIGPGNWTAARYRIGYNYAVGVVRYWWGFYEWEKKLLAAAKSNQGAGRGGQGVFDAPPQ
jgi:hypothetical protein